MADLSPTNANSAADAAVDNSAADPALTVTSPPPAPNSGNNNAAAAARVNNKMAAQTAQLNKMRDANAKYKNLLMMAKERIQQQEEELEQLRSKFGRGEQALVFGSLFF